MIRFFATFFIFLFSINAFCETNDQPPVKKGQGSIYLTYGKVNFDPKQANQENVDPSASYIRLGGEYREDNGIFGGGMSIFSYNDSAGFQQYVQDQYGNVTTASSNASSVNLYGEIGYTASLTDSLRADLLGGYELVVESNRSIPSCSNCDKEAIDIKSGLYVTPRLGLNGDFSGRGHWEITLSYAKGIGGNVENITMLTFGFGGI